MGGERSHGILRISRCISVLSVTTEVVLEIYGFNNNIFYGDDRTSVYRYLTLMGLHRETFLAFPTIKV